MYVRPMRRIVALELEFMSMDLSVDECYLRVCDVRKTYFPLSRRSLLMCIFRVRGVVLVVVCRV